MKNKWRFIKKRCKINFWICPFNRLSKNKFPLALKITLKRGDCRYSNIVKPSEHSEETSLIHKSMWLFRASYRTLLKYFKSMWLFRASYTTLLKYFKSIHRRRVRNVRKSEFPISSWLCQFIAIRIFCFKTNIVQNFTIKQLGNTKYI